MYSIKDQHPIFNRWGYLKDPTNYINADFEDRRTLLNELWYESNLTGLIQYYRSFAMMQGGGFRSPTFYELAPIGYSVNLGDHIERNNFTIYHTPIANIITRSMVGLLFSGEPIIQISTKNQRRTKKENEILDEILKFNDFTNKLKEAGEKESWSGVAAFKIVIDQDFSPYPIIQCYSKKDIIEHRKYGKLVSIVFKDYYVDDKDINKKYILLSEYGKGYIEYKLLDSERKDVPFERVSSIKDLQPIRIKNKDGSDFEHILAAVKYNNENGISDYTHIIPDFIALDEVYSNKINFIRKSKMRVQRSQRSLKKTEAGESILPSVYDTDFDILWDSDLDEMKGTPTQSPMPDILDAVQGYIEAETKILKNIAVSVGLTPRRLTGDTEGGANTSAKALDIRESENLKTRDSKITGWTIFTRHLVLLLASIGDDVSLVNNTLYINNKMDKLDVSVEFYNPFKPRFIELVGEVATLRNEGLIDHKSAIERLWVDLTKLKNEQEANAIFKAIIKEQQEEEEDRAINLKKKNDNSQPIKVSRDPAKEARESSKI